MSIRTGVPGCVATVLVAGITCAASVGGAQAAPGNDSILLARAGSITVGEYCRMARDVLAAPAVHEALGDDQRAAALSTGIICAVQPSSLSLRALRGTEPVSLRALTRLGTRAYGGTSATTFEAMDAFRMLVRGPVVRPIVRSALGDSVAQRLAVITETAFGLLSLDARDAALQRLANYERKLGPTSARLNGVEVLANWGAQKWIPGFRPTPRGGPSPWEAVAAYVPTYATVDSSRAVAVSASEFGLRRYLFGKAFGAEGWRGLIRPAYWSAGMLVVSDRNGALVWPWDGRTRHGIFASWGATKVGYVSGRNGEWLISHQLQTIPLVF